MKLRWIICLICGCGFAASSAPTFGQAVLTIDEARVALIRDVRVPAMEPGVLIELDVREGDVVEPDQQLGKIDTSVAERELEAARYQQAIAEVQAKNDINLRFAEKSKEVADADVFRADRAVDAYEKSISRAEIDQLRLVAERSLLAREQAELELEAARLTYALRDEEVAIAARRLENRHVRSPFAGIIVEVYEQAGEWVQAGDPIARLIQLDPMEVEVFVDGYQHGVELVGRPVTFSSRIAPDRTPAQWSGKVTFVSPIMHPVTGEVRVLAEVENADGRMRPGMVGQLTVR